MAILLWRNRPMREVMNFRTLKERDCATVTVRYRVLPPFPSLCLLLGYAVTVMKDDETSVSRHTTIAAARRFSVRSALTNSTQCCVLRVLDSSVDRRD
jgi:hypothetical protein